MNLAEWLSINKIADNVFGEQIGRSPSTVSRIKRGLVRPDWSTMDAIKLATNGEVTPNDFIAEQLEASPSPFPEAAQ